MNKKPNEIINDGKNIFNFYLLPMPDGIKEDFISCIYNKYIIPIIDKKIKQEILKNPKNQSEFEEWLAQRNLQTKGEQA